MGAREQVLRDFLGFPQRLQAPGPHSWAAPTGEAREPRALTPREGFVRGPCLHGTRPALSNRLKTALDPRAGCPALGVPSGREAGVSGVGRTPHLLARTAGNGSDVTQPPRASARLRHGHSAVGCLCPASCVETGRNRGSGKGGGAPGRLLCPLCVACPGSSGLAVASSKAPGFCLVVGKSEPRPLSPSCEDLRRGRKWSSGGSPGRPPS